MYEQRNLGSRKHFMNTLLMHGVSEDEFRRLPKREQDSLKHRLNVRITETLEHWFPDTACLDQVDDSDVYEWQTESDVHEVLHDFLLEKGYVTVSG